MLLLRAGNSITEPRAQRWIVGGIEVLGTHECGTGIDIVSRSVDSAGEGKRARKAIDGEELAGLLRSAVPVIAWEGP